MDIFVDKIMNEENLFNLIGGVDTFGLENAIFNIIVTMLLGLFIYFIYKKTFSGVMYSQNFNVTVVMICIITAIVMMLIGNNLALSLGLVGSLSIIRFRTAIKEPRDIGFLFWAIAVGLAGGTSEFMIAIIGSVMIAILLLVFSKVIYSNYSYLLILKGKEIESNEIIEVLNELKVPFKLRMKNMNREFSETTYEVSLKKVDEDSLIRSFKSITGIEEVHIVSYNGEISG